MVFSSLLFVYAFLPLSLLVYFICPNRRSKNVSLLVFSLIFYAWGEPKYVLLLMFMALFLRVGRAEVCSAADVHGAVELVLRPAHQRLALHRDGQDVADDLDRGGYRAHRLFQILPADLLDLRDGPRLRRAHRAADRHFVLYLPADDLRRRRLPRRRPRPAQLLERAALRGAVPPVRRRPDRPLQDPCARAFRQP